MASLVNLKSLGPHFFKIMYCISHSVYIKMSFTQLEKYSHLLFDRDFANERVLLRQFDVSSSSFNKIKEGSTRVEGGPLARFTNGKIEDHGSRLQKFRFP